MADTARRKRRKGEPRGPTAARDALKGVPYTTGPSRTRLLVAGIALVFTLKLVVILQLKNHVLTQPDAGLDTTAYAGLADRVIAGDVGLGPGLYFLSPLYIYFLAAVLAIGHSFTAVRLIQIALGTAAVALVFVTADEWFGRRAAWLAAALATLTGVFTFYESLILQTALDPFLTAAALTCLTLGLRRSEGRWFALAGLVFGVHACNRPNVALPALVIALLLATARRWQAFAAFSVALAIALVPVTLRNVVVSRHWSPVTASHGGLNFYIGNNGQADGTYHAVPGVTPDIKGQQEDTRRVAEQATGHALDDAGVSSYFYGLGWSWIRDRPMAAAALFARKLSLTVSAKYFWLNYSYEFFARDAGTLLRALVVGPWLLIPLGLVGLVWGVTLETHLKRPGVANHRGGRERAVAGGGGGAPPHIRKRSDYMIWGSFIPVYALAVAAFYVSDRYQLLLLIPLCVCAGAAIDVMAKAASARDWRSLGVPTIALVVLLVWVNRPLPYDEGVAEERTRMAERLVTLGRYDEAERWAERAVEVHPQPGIVHVRVAQQLAAHDRYGPAIAHFQKALALDPNQPVVSYALGATLLEAARPQEAVAHLRRAFESGDRPDVVGYDLVRALGAAGQREDAIRVLERIRPSRDDDAERWVALSTLALQLQEPRLTQTFARKAIAIRPDLPAAHGQLGDGLNLEGRWSDAARELDEAIRLDPRSAAPHVGHAVADANMGRVADARRHIDEALRLDPQSEPARRVKQALEQRRP